MFEVCQDDPRNAEFRTFLDHPFETSALGRRDDQRERRRRWGGGGDAFDCNLNGRCLTARRSRCGLVPFGILEDAVGRTALTVKQHDCVTVTEPQASQGMTAFVITECDDVGGKLRTVQVRRIHAADYTA
jgi:hypothetical protein